jgi:iron complex outermembrane receptor protein
VNERVSLFLDVRNLGDEAYVSNVQAAVTATAATAAYWPGDGRAVFAGVTVTF